MSERSISECMDILKKNDVLTLERRAKRLQELGVTQTSSSFQREWDYSTEAGDCYINGNYRSAIFCSACAVEQIFKYEYLKVPGHRHKDWGKGEFGKIIDKCKDTTSLDKYIDSAELLNNIRIKVAAHPIFIDIPIRTDDDRKIRNDMLLLDIKILLNLVGKINESYKNEIESIEINTPDGYSFRHCSIGEVIGRKSQIPSMFDGIWRGIVETDVLKSLARKALDILKEVSEGLYGIPDFP